MRRAQALQEIQRIEFERIYTGWRSKNPTPEGQALG